MNGNYFRQPHTESTAHITDSEDWPVHAQAHGVAPRIPARALHADDLKSRQLMNRLSVSSQNKQGGEFLVNETAQSMKLYIKKPLRTPEAQNHTSSASEQCMLSNNVNDRKKSLVASIDSMSDEPAMKKPSFSRISPSHSSNSSLDQNARFAALSSRSPPSPLQNNDRILFNQNKVFALADIFMNHSAAEIFTPIPLLAQPPQPQQPVPDAPARLFAGLSNVLKKHYNSEYIDEDDLIISEPEIKILKAILTRKYNIKYFGLYASDNLMSILRKIDNFKSCKRLEENYKFVLSRCIKHLKKQLPKGKHRKIRKREFDTYFYQYYFGDVCKSANVNLQDFHIPRASADIVLKTKTISDEYISRLTQSKLFTQACLSYMGSQLREDYKAEMNSKIDKLVESWESTYKDAGDKEKVVDGIVGNIVHSQRFKLPWVSSEVDVAIESVRSIFSKYSSCC